MRLPVDVRAIATTPPLESIDDVEVARRMTYEIHHRLAAPIDCAPLTRQADHSVVVRPIADGGSAESFGRENVGDVEGVESIVWQILPGGVDHCCWPSVGAVVDGLENVIPSALATGRSRLRGMLRVEPSLG